MLILAEFTPLNPVSGSRITLRASNAQDRRVTGLNDQVWWPAITASPALSMNLFDGDFTDAIAPGSAAFAVQIATLAKQDAAARGALWQGAAVTFYSGNAGDAWPWPTLFVGNVVRYEAEGDTLRLTAEVDTEKFSKDVLSATYAGTTGIEGGADLKGKPKPWLLGRCFNVEPILINAVDSVFQVSAYGAIQAVNALYERGASMGASVGDYADYAALVAATIPAGRWATCLASGLIRLGAPPYGVITADVDGDKFGGTWRRLTGEIITRITTGAGISAGDIDSTSISALDTALAGLPNAGRIGIYLTDQASVMDTVRSLALPCNAQAGVSWLGKLFVTRVSLSSPTITLDAQGRQMPPVTRSIESDVSPPYKRIVMGAARSWRVHTFDEVAFDAELVERGIYEGATVYRNGNIVSVADGTRYLYINDTPTAGNAPPNGIYWEEYGSGPTRNVHTGAWASGVAYSIGDIVSYAGSSYSATTNHTSSIASPPPNGNFALLSAAGLSTGVVYLYKRTATNVAPAVPSSTLSYNLTTNAITGSLDGWSQIEPPVTAGSWLWETLFYVAGPGPTVSLPSSGWLTPPNRLRNDDYQAEIQQTGFGVPCALDGSVDPLYMAMLETQLIFRTSGQIFVSDTQDTAGVTVALVSAGGGAATINTAAGVPIAGKPKGFIRITALAAGTGPTSFTFKATFGGIDYPAALPIVVARNLPEPPINSYLVRIYKRTTTNVAPAVPSGNVTYTYADNTIAGSLSGWSQVEPPLSAGSYLWETNHFTQSSDPTSVITPADWLATANLVRNDDYYSATSLTSSTVPAAPDGTVDPFYFANFTTQLYFRTSGQIFLSDTQDTAGVTVALVSAGGGAATINTAAGVPVAGKPKGHIKITGLAAGTGPTSFVFKAVYQGVDYPTPPIVVTKNLATVPIKSFLVRLYKRTATNVAPALIDNDVTYTFTDNSISGSMDGWTQVEPAVTAGPYLWETWYFASAQATTLVIVPADWHAAQLVRSDDYMASFTLTGWTMPSAADGTVSPSLLPLETQLILRTNATILLHSTIDTPGVTVSLVSVPSGVTATINTAANTPVSGKPKGYIKITALPAGTATIEIGVKASYQSVDYPATLTITKAVAGVDARALRLTASKERITRDAWGRVSPSGQTVTFTPARENFAAGTVTWEVRNALNVSIGTAPTYGTIVGGTFQMTADQVIAAAGTTRGVIVFITDTAGPVPASAFAWLDDVSPTGDTEWPDPPLNAADTYYAGGALVAPFSIQTNGAASGYKYNNYVRVVSTTTPTSEFYAKVAEKVPVRAKDEAFYWGYTGGNGVGAGALGAGIYAIFRDIDNVQVGTTQKLFTTSAMTPTGDWPQKSGVIYAPADAAYVEFGWYRNNHGVITSTQAQLINPYFSRVQPNATNTEANQAKLEGLSDQVLFADYAGALLSGQLNRTIKAVLKVGGTDVSESATWSTPDSNNCTVSISSTPGSRGLVTLSDSKGDGYFIVQAVYNNAVMRQLVPIDWSYGFLPQGLGDNVVYDQLGSTLVTNTSFGSTPVIGPYTVSTKSVGQLTFFGKLVLSVASGTGYGEIKPQYRVVGSGTWLDAGITLQSDTITFDANLPKVAASSGATFILGTSDGILTNTNYEVRWLARKQGTPTSITLLPGVYWARGR